MAIGCINGIAASTGFYKKMDGHLTVAEKSGHKNDKTVLTS